MYYAVMAALVVIGGGMLIHAWQSRRRGVAAVGVAVIAGTFLFFVLLDFWGEMLWFRELGYAHRFWTKVLAQAGLAAAAALIGGAAVYGLTRFIPRDSVRTRYWPEALGVVAGGVWGLNHWDTALLFWNQVSTGIGDPILGRDVGFYLFVLPLYDAVYSLLFWIAVIGLAAGTVFLFVPRNIDEAFWRRAGERVRHAGPQSRVIYPVLAAFLLVLAWGRYLDVFHLLYSEWGVVSGPGWTDVHIRRPAYYITAAVLALAGAFLVSLGVSERAYRRLVGRERWWTRRPLANSLALVAAVWFGGLGIVPGLVQWLRVEPNEITLERPYIEHNIAFTRQAFGLGKVEEREFPVAEEFTAQTIEQNRHIINEIRLWDPRALDAVYKQFQEIRLYYEFADVDIDRYAIDGNYRQVMVSAREMKLANLPQRSQTFVNRHFKYTHGFGLTLAPVSEFTEDGLPSLLVKDLPPVSEYKTLAVEQPRIYYGELTTRYAVANSSEMEFDFPRGDRNVYIHYDGKGGVPLSNLWRKFLFGWKLGGTRLLFSGYPTRESQILFHRHVRERVQTLAPFLEFDADPYVVLGQGGKLYWIIDGYTTSRSYPYSEPFRSPYAATYLNGNNYLRNSVKAVVDAYHGSVTFYVFEPDDPLIQAWSRIFPDLLRPKEDMPEHLVRHVRYPEGLLLVQGLVYGKYHMTDPAVFYNQEDLWVQATERYYGDVRTVEPYYVMWEPPESDEAEFVLMMPFTPKDKQVLIGWVAGMCDGENYGRLLGYQFPKEKRVLGTQQVETKVDQHRLLSQTLTLWDQRGSRVIRGNLLVIPIGETLLYVEPIYLQAEASPYPELRLVVTMHGDRISYAETFEQALEGLFREEGRELPPGAPTPAEGPPSELARRAHRAFEEYLRLSGERKFREAAEQLGTLQETLEQLVEETEAAETAAGAADAKR